MNLFSLFRKRKPEADATVDERVITPSLLAKHNIEVRHLINDKWAAWHVGISDRGGIDRNTGHVWPSSDTVVRYVWCDTRERALLAAVRYLAAKGVTMPEPQPTGVTVSIKDRDGLTVVELSPPTVTPLPATVPHTGEGIDVDDLRKPEPPHGGGTILSDY